MNDFEKRYFDGNESSADPSVEAEHVADEEAAEEKKEAVEGVNFNSDGTYHGVHKEVSEAEYQNYNGANVNNSNNFAGQQYNNQGQYGYYQQGPYNYSQRGYGYPPNMPPQYNNQNFQYSQKTANEEKYAYPVNDSEKQETAKKNKTPKVIGIIVAVLCVVLVGVLVAIALDNSEEVTAGNNEPGYSEDVSENVEEFETSASPATEDKASSDGMMTPKEIYQNILPSSVGILVYNKSKMLSSEGSGVFFQESSDGKYTYIITCAHVIKEEAGKIRVQTYDSKEYDAELVGFDARTDIGVIRIEQTGFDLAEIGDSSQISVGDYIYAIGNPGGVEFANSFTDGIVSALDRPVNSSSTGYTTECIQHTAAINPGNSGGALVNSFGQVIGINSMKIVADEYEGMGFAVPSSVFVKIVNEIMANGYVSNRPKLGITYVPASEYNNYGMFVAIKELPAGSIVIYSISPDSSLASTKVQEGDMIISVNGTPLDDPSYLSELIENSEVGDTITLGIIRINEDYSYEEFDAQVTLVEDRGDTFATQEETTTDSYSGGYGEYGDSYEDFFNEYFEDFFNDRFGGFAP